MSKHAMKYITNETQAKDNPTTIKITTVSIRANFTDDYRIYLHGSQFWW